MPKRPYIVADAILDTLKAHGITTMFGYPGGVLLPFYDVLPYHQMKHVLVRHEQGAAFAAQGWARTTKKIGVCMATSGPGATNLITGIADAMLDSIPMLCFTGQVPVGAIGKDSFQEIDITGITLSITKHNYLADNPDEIVGIVSEAIAIANSGRPGPVLIDVPKDVMAAPHPRKFKIPKIDLKKINPITEPDKKAVRPVVINQVVNALNKAKRPVLLLGQGVKFASAEEKVDKFIKKTRIPTVTTLLAKGVIKEGNPDYLGMLGMHGFYHSNMAICEADLILNIGSRFDDRIVGCYQSFGQRARVIHVDLDKSELDKVVKNDISIHSDAAVFVDKMLKSWRLKRLSIAKWWHKIDSWRKEKPYLVTNPKEFCVRDALNSIKESVRRNLAKQIILADVGQHQMWTALCSEVPETTAWLTSGGLGTMGASFPMAVGAAFANPKKNIICVTGDGGFQMNMQELGTVAANNLNVKICIMNNNFLGMVRQWQELFYNKVYSETEMPTPDFKKVAEAYGIEAYVVKNNKQAKEAARRISNKKGPMLIEYKVAREDNVLPMVPGGKTLAEMVLEDQ